MPSKKKRISQDEALENLLFIKYLFLKINITTNILFHSCMHTVVRCILFIFSVIKLNELIQIGEYDKTYR